MRKSIEYFQQAIQLDPGYAIAYAGLADSLITTAGDEAARVAATRAIEIDATLAEPHATLAAIMMGPEWDWVGAESEFKRSIVLDPAYPTAYHWYSIYLLMMARHEEALWNAQRAAELDPLSLIIRTNLAYVLTAVGRTEECHKEIRKALELDSSFAPAHIVLGRIWLRKRAYADAIREIQLGKDLGFPADEALQWLGYAYGMSGDKARAEEAIGEMQELARRDRKPPPSGRIAWVYVGLGDKSRALDWLEKAYAQRADELSYLKVDPVLDPLRSDPRFQDLLRRMNLPE
jgi:tetratricopeptide (TPR) repeat protein